MLHTADKFGRQLQLVLVPCRCSNVLLQNLTGGTDIILPVAKLDVRAPLSPDALKMWAKVTKVPHMSLKRQYSNKPQCPVTF